MIEIVATATRLGTTVRAGFQGDAAELQGFGVRDDDYLRLLDAELEADTVPMFECHRTSGPPIGHVVEGNVSGNRFIIRAQLDQRFAPYFRGYHHVELSAGITAVDRQRRDSVVEARALIREVSLAPVGRMPGCYVHSVRQL